MNTTSEPQPAGADAQAAPEPPAAAPPSALGDLGSHLRFWPVVVAGLVVDLWSKEWAFRVLRQGGDRVLIPKLLEFHTTLNPGALFGLGRGQTGLFVLASLLALVLVLWIFAHCPRDRWLTHVALGAILAGALGNMYDRVNVRLVHPFQNAAGRVPLFCVRADDPENQRIILTEYPVSVESARFVLPASTAADLPPVVGYVRDFIKISQKWFGGRDVWPWVFNVADMLLVGGVGILAVRMLRERRPASTAAAGEVELDGAGEKT